MAKAATGGGKGRGDHPRAPIPPPTGQRTPLRRFVRESWGELRKVQWPTRQQVVQGTMVVGIVTIFFATYLFAMDQIMSRVVEKLDNFIMG